MNPAVALINGGLDSSGSTLDHGASISITRDSFDADAPKVAGETGEELKETEETQNDSDHLKKFGPCFQSILKEIGVVKKELLERIHDRWCAEYGESTKGLEELECRKEFYDLVIDVDMTAWLGEDWRGDQKKADVNPRRATHLSDLMVDPDQAIDIVKALGTIKSSDEAEVSTGEETKWGASFDSFLKEFDILENEVVKRVRARWYAQFVEIYGLVEDESEEDHMEDIASFFEVQKKYFKFVLADELYKMREEERHGEEEEEEEKKDLDDEYKAKVHVGKEVDVTIQEEVDYEYKGESKDYGHMCTIACDFLCGLESVTSLGSKFDRKICSKALAAFRRCYTDGLWTVREVGDDTLGVDLRGRHVADALRLLVMYIYAFSRQPDIKRLFVSVGCMVHGCGEGILKNAVTELLKRDKRILIDFFDEDDSTISIEIPNAIDCSALGWTFFDRKPGEKSYYPSPEEITKEEITKGEVENYDHWCIIFCDFLCDLDTTEVGLLCDSQINKKVLSGFGKCHKDEPQNLEEGTVILDLRGEYVEVALEIMMLHLFCFGEGDDVKKMLVRVGCYKHGCGEGKLKKAVIDLLKSDKEKSIEYVEEKTTISITLNGRTDYSCIGWTREKLMESRIFKLYD